MYKDQVDNNLIKPNLSVSFFDLLGFFFKIIFSEKSYIIFFIVINLFSFLVAFIFNMVSHDEKLQNQIFDFYSIIYSSILLFLIIVRSIIFFLVKKVDDKTTFLIISGQVSRSKFFLTQLLTFLILLIITIFLSYLYFNLLSLFFNHFTINNFIFRKTIVFLIYNLLIGISLILFNIFLLILIGSQGTIIITTVFLSLSFVANIPLKIITTKNDKLSLSFNNDSNPRTPIAVRVEDIYKAITLQNLIKNNKIKYNYLSNAINDFFTDYTNGYIISDNFSESINKRLEDFWNNKLKIIKENKDNEDNYINYSLQGIVEKNNTEMNKNSSKWLRKKVSINFKLKTTFMSYDEMVNVYNTMDDNYEYKNALKDFLDFYNYILTINEDIQKAYPEYFSTFINFLPNSENNLDVNYISNDEVSDSEGKPLKLNFSSSDLESIFKFNVSSPMSGDNLAVGPIDNENNDIYNFFYNELYFPTSYVANILENYFIKYTTDFFNSTQRSIIINNSYNEYVNVRNQANLFAYLNPFYGFWTTYTYYSGNSYSETWFSKDNKSYINLEDQQNVFLPYLTYDFKIVDGFIDYESINNYYDPKITVFVIFVSTIFLYVFAHRRFLKIDIS
ncbi:transmembrane protein [Spiroplasma turonicum]|uniref:Transmembrane protein n=1 Tax=Spiroplasma turonicum TaxID=216946 RepID=A0A0K1P6A7_9MOLU|nr:hypothetical protein [Spiroplasma turonicum]AKU79805.1 transmembrane protein [Spiroplasma turonicum]